MGMNGIDGDSDSQNWLAKFLVCLHPPPFTDVPPPWSGFTLAIDALDLTIWDASLYNESIVLKNCAFSMTPILIRFLKLLLAAALAQQQN